MANYSYINNGITFTLPEFDEKTVAKYTQKFMYANNYQRISERGGGLEPFVNAVEIDWNSAIIGEG